MPERRIFSPEEGASKRAVRSRLPPDLRPDLSPRYLVLRLHRGILGRATMNSQPAAERFAAFVSPR